MLDRAELLRENIRSQQEELAHLESSDSMRQRLAASAMAITNFKSNVVESKALLVRIEEQVSSAYANFELATYRWHIEFLGRGLYDPTVRQLIDGASLTLANLLLSRYRQQDSIRQLEERLADLERIAAN